MKMDKLSRVILLFLVVVTTILSTVGEVLAKEVPQSITVNTTTPTHLGYIGEKVNFGRKTLTDGTIAYCLEYNKKTPLTTTVSKIGEMDAGMVYLLENGYPTKSITGDQEKDYYITQTAIWWYLDETTSISPKNLPDSFKTTDSDPQNLRAKIKNLVEGAKVAKNKGYKNPKMTASGKTTALSLSSDKTYYISEEISVTLTDLDNYNVSISNAPEGSYVADKTGNKKNTFNAGETFRVYVPSDKADKNKTTNIEVTITSSTTYNKAYRYSSNDDEEQDIIPVLLFPTTVTATAKVTLNITPKTIKPSQVKILKIDAETKKPLKGAVLVIKDETGKIVAEFTTTEEEYVIDDLANGKYTVEETKAPAGYELSDKKYSFTIDDENRSYTLSFENYPSIDVPDTNSNISIIMYILGALITISGVSYIRYNAQKQN